MRVAGLLVVAVAVSSGCSDSNGPGSPGPASAFKVVSGNGQHTTVGAALPSPIVVQAVDAQSRTIPGLTVTFALLSGGGSVTAASATTNAQGQASTTWTLGTKADTQRVSASVTGGSLTLVDTIVAVAIAGPPKTITVLSGNQQIGGPGYPVPESLAVTVSDQYQNPVSGVAVTWTVSAGSGAASPTSSTTSAAGAAKTSWTLGNLGANTVAAGATGVSPIAFHATAVTNNPNVHVRILQRNDTITSLTAKVAFGANVTDQNGFPISGAMITWATTAPGVFSAKSSGAVSALVVSNAVGSGQLIAEYAGSADTVPVVVDQVAYSIAFANKWFFVTLNQTAQIQAHVFDASGVVIPNAPLTWQYDQSFATISGTGLVTGLTVGTIPVIINTPLMPGGPSATGGLGVTREAATAQFTQVAVDSDHACGLDSDGESFCWGMASGAIGNGFGCLNSNFCFAPVLTGGGYTFSQIAVTDQLTCAITAAGATYCWGQSPLPQALAGAPPFTAVTLGPGFGCGLASGEAAYCWGANTDGNLGNGTVTNAPTPVAVSGGLAFTSVTAGTNFACGLEASGAAYCWGVNTDGELGNGNQSVDSCSSVACSRVPVPVAGAHVFTVIAANANHACGVQADGSAWCWGGNSDGSLGTGSNTGPSTSSVCSPDPNCSLVPVQVTGGIHLTTITAGNSTSCGLDASGNAYCWGNNVAGAVGDGQIGGIVATPTRVVGGITFARLSAGDAVCGVTSSGKTYCWGSEATALLGTTATNMQNTGTPQLVTLP
jgi:hypothetical protein